MPDKTRNCSTSDCASPSVGRWHDCDGIAQSASQVVVAVSRSASRVTEKEPSCASWSPSAVPTSAPPARRPTSRCIVVAVRSRRSGCRALLDAGPSSPAASPRGWGSDVNPWREGYVVARYQFQRDVLAVRAKHGVLATLGCCRFGGDPRGHPAEPRGEPASEEVGLRGSGGGVRGAGGVLDAHALDAVEIRTRAAASSKNCAANSRQGSWRNQLRSVMPRLVFLRVASSLRRKRVRCPLVASELSTIRRSQPSMSASKRLVCHGGSPDHQRNVGNPEITSGRRWPRRRRRHGVVVRLDDDLLAVRPLASATVALLNAERDLDPRSWRLLWGRNQHDGARGDLAMHAADHPPMRWLRSSWPVKAIRVITLLWATTGLPVARSAWAA